MAQTGRFARLRDMTKAVGTESTQSHGPLGLLWARTDTQLRKICLAGPLGSLLPSFPTLEVTSLGCDQPCKFFLWSFSFIYLGFSHTEGYTTQQ